MAVPRWIIGPVLSVPVALTAALGVTPAWAADAPAASESQPSNLIRNGSFEVIGANGVPTGWRTEGRKGIEQAISQDAGPEGKKALKLTCTKFVPGFPDSHAMASLRGSVDLKKGQSYRLAWWIKGQSGADDLWPGLSAAVETPIYLLAEDVGVWRGMFAAKSVRSRPSTGLGS